MKMCLIYKNILRCFLLFTCYFAFSNDLSGYEESDEEDDIEECFSRYAFPSICVNHFSNNIGIKNSWMEAESLEDINCFSDYLHIIPKVYDADCYQCYDCNGVGFNLYRGYDSPANEVDASEQLKNGHIQKLRVSIYEKGRCDWLHSNDHCESLCWYGGYFRLWNHTYLHLFKHYLQYCSENDDCQCYWPECDLDATEINNSVYNLLKDLAEDGLITHELSSYWQASRIEFDYYGKIYTDLYYPNSHGMAASLTNYAFFYSQYHQMLLSVAEFIDSNFIKDDLKAIDRIYALLERIRNRFIRQYNLCIRSHPHPKIYYERGMLRLHSGNVEDAFMDVNRLMRMAKTDRYKDEMILTTEMYQQEGEIYADLGRYDKAIASLSEAIQLDPNNRGAHFSRAQAYFETGEFDQSLDDYLKSKNHSGSLEPKLKHSATVKESVLSGLQEGCAEAVVDFVPSLCSSAYGLCSSMWVFAQHPVDSTTQFVNACYDIGNCINEFRKNVDLDEIESYPIEIQRMYDQFDRLSEAEKGRQIGYIVGRYGVDIFAGGAAIKGIAAFKKLKDANRICMLEAMTISETNKELVIASAFKHKTEREAFFKNVKLEWDKQNKHILGRHNFQEGKSILTHKNPPELLKKSAGKGEKVRGKIGQSGYQEIVDFAEPIGYNVDQNGVQTLTTWGKIHYSNDGAHIVPTMPKK